MKNDSNLANKKQKKINKIKDQLAQLRAKLKASENKQSLSPSKPKLKKIKSENKQSLSPSKPKLKKIKSENKQAENKKIKLIDAQRKAKEAKKKEARIKVEAQRKAKEEAKKKEEEAKKKEEEAKRTYEDELEEQLSEEEITGFQLEKTDMDKMCNRVCEMIAGYENEGTLQSELWKKLKLSSRDGSRLALKLERMGMITREKILEKQRWTYKLIIKKIPISTKSIEGAPCLTCPVQSKCSIDGEISPKTCQWIEDWVLIELKNK